MSVRPSGEPAMGSHRQSREDDGMRSTDALPSARVLDAEDFDLIRAAEQVIDGAMDSGPGEPGVYTVGCAIRSSDGSIRTAVNLYHFTGGPCAEIVALAAARAEGIRSVERIVAVRRFGRGVIAPCGRCRQVLADYHPGIRVVVVSDGGELINVAVEDLLLPLAFSREE